MRALCAASRPADRGAPRLVRLQRFEPLLLRQAALRQTRRRDARWRPSWARRLHRIAAVQVQRAMQWQGDVPPQWPLRVHSRLLWADLRHGDQMALRLKLFRAWHLRDGLLPMQAAVLWRRLLAAVAALWSTAERGPSRDWRSRRRAVHEAMRIRLRAACADERARLEGGAALAILRARSGRLPRLQSSAHCSPPLEAPHDRSGVCRFILRPNMGPARLMGQS